MNNIRHNWLPVLLAAAAGWPALLSAQTVIPAFHALPVSAADTNQSGFIWNVSEVANSEPNQLSWAEGQLAGLEGDNLADPTVVGIATGPSSPPNPSTAPISFTIPTVINLSKTAGTTKGNFTPDDQMPGIPGTGGSTDNIAAEILTYLNLPAGIITMGVNSDDGFRVTIGGAVPQDRMSVNVGEFDGGRGANDTIFQFQITQAGLYAARVLYENGGGDANVEWFTVLDGINGTNKVLINDTNNANSIPAYHVVTQSHAYFSQVDPAISGSGVLATEGVHLTLVDGSAPVATSSISLAVDGSPVSATIAKNGNTTSIDYTNPVPWLPLSPHGATVVFTDGTLHVTNTWSWTVAYYISLDSTWLVANADTSKPGFNWNIFANADANNLANNNERTERDLSLQAVDSSGNSLPNLADPNASYAAVGPAAAPNPPNAPVHFEIPGTIKFDIAPTSNMPGAPSTDTTTDGQAAEVLTYLQLPAGIVAMQIDSDDGWRLYGGPNPADLFGRAVIAEHQNGTGPVKFSFLVPQAGVYPFRLVWENGQVGSRLNWSTINSSGTTVLVNDTANGGINAYRALVGGATLPPVIVGSQPLAAMHTQLLANNTNLLVVLADGTHGIQDSSVKLSIDGKSVTPITQRQGSYLTVNDGGAGFPGLQLQVDLHAATITYSDTTGTYSRTQTWNFNNIESIWLPANPLISENFDSYPEATSSANTVPPGWTNWNFTAPNTPGWDLTDKSSDSYKDWIIISTTTMGNIESSSLNNNPNQLVNGQPVATWVSGNVLWATSDGRSAIQAQFCISKPFDLSSITNPVMIFSSIVRMSAEANEQADGIEYSVDGGKTWNPGIIYVSIAHTRPDYVLLAPDGSIDAVRTLNLPFAVLQWVDPVSHQTVGGTPGSGLAEPITQALAPYMTIRDDTPTISQKVDGIRLPLASRQKDVRLRFYQLGNCSWWWGVDNLAFYDIAPPFVVTPPAQLPHIDSITQTGGQITIKWSNGGTLQFTPTLTNPVWTSTGNSTGTFTTPATGAAQFYRVSR
jgi:hypothetical protein